MRRGFVLAWITVSSACAVGVGVQARATARAQALAISASARHVIIIGQCRELARLRAELPDCLAGQEDSLGLTPRIQRALATAGLPTSTLVGLSPHGSSVVSAGVSGNTEGARVLRTASTVTLAPISLPQLGSFLSRWGVDQPCWWVASIELAPEARSPGQAAGPGMDQPLRVTLVLETVTLEAHRGGP